MTALGIVFFVLRKVLVAPLWRRLALLSLVVCVAVPFVLRPAYGNLPANLAGEVTETSVKAAFLYRFIGYVEWPPSAFRTPESPYVIGVIGADDLADKLRYLLVGRSAGQRSVEVRQIGINDALEQVHILYVGEVPREQMEGLLRRAQQQSAMSVTDFGEARYQPSVIQFKMIDNRIRFNVALDVAERSKLKISSRMLAVAHQVKRSGS